MSNMIMNLERDEPIKIQLGKRPKRDIEDNAGKAKLTTPDEEF